MKEREYTKQSTSSEAEFLGWTKQEVHLGTKGRDRDYEATTRNHENESVKILDMKNRYLDNRSSKRRKRETFQ